MLGRFGFLFTHGAHHRYERYVHEGHVFASDTELELTQRLHVGRGFDVADRATEFDDAGVGASFATIGRPGRHVFNPVLNGIGDVGDDLHRFAEVVASPVSLDDFGVDFSGGEVVVL